MQVNDVYTFTEPVNGWQLPGGNDPVRVGAGVAVKVTAIYENTIHAKSQRTGEAFAFQRNTFVRCAYWEGRSV